MFLVDRLWSWISGLWPARQVTAQGQMATSTPSLVAPALPAADKPQPAAQEPTRTYGRWDSLKGLLDTAGDYRESVTALRRFDPFLYELYAKAGGVILPQSAVLFASPELPASWRSEEGGPMFGAIHLCADDEDDEILNAKMVTFLKYRHIDGIEKPKGDLYQVVVSYYDRKKSKMMCFGYCVDVCRDGSVRTLRERVVGHARGDIPTTSWVEPRFTKLLAEDHKSRGLEPSFWTDGAALFKAFACASEYSADGLQVRAEMGGQALVFYIDMLRTPEFFRDRDPVIGDDGKRKRIFHIARAHRREAASGAIYVRSHFRGARRFRWNGYDVVISMPGLHHARVRDLTVAATQRDRRAGKMYSLPQAAGMIRTASLR